MLIIDMIDRKLERETVETKPWSRRGPPHPCFLPYPLPGEGEKYEELHINKIGNVTVKKKRNICKR